MNSTSLLSEVIFVHYLKHTLNILFHDILIQFPEDQGRWKKSIIYFFKFRVIIKRITCQFIHYDDYRLTASWVTQMAMIKGVLLIDAFP